MLSLKIFLSLVALLPFFCNGYLCSQVTEDSSSIKITGNSLQLLPSSNFTINSAWQCKGLEVLDENDRILGVGDLVFARSNESKITFAFAEWNPLSETFTFRNEHYLAMKLGICDVLVQEHGEGNLLMYRYELKKTKLNLYSVDHRNVKELFKLKPGKNAEIPVETLNTKLQNHDFVEAVFLETESIRLERSESVVKREHQLLVERQNQKLFKLAKDHAVGERESIEFLIDDRGELIENLKKPKNKGSEQQIKGVGSKNSGQNK